MEGLKELPKTPTASLLNGDNTTRVGGRAPGQLRAFALESQSVTPPPVGHTQAHSEPFEPTRSDHSRTQEVIVWIGIATILMTGAMAFYTLWIRASAGM